MKQDTNQSLCQICKFDKFTHILYDGLKICDDCDPTFQRKKERLGKFLELPFMKESRYEDLSYDHF